MDGEGVVGVVIEVVAPTAEMYFLFGAVPFVWVGCR